ncbi:MULTISPECIES: restriction endonuclease subunit S [Klebsiella]|uniref:restriction endonuclease subunit S n=1 Tax=Klebsiella TaxID=570 RepID=UPI00292BCEB9|nr:restriction endonuclease subunit S [Klebsiella pasteurii]MDV1071941.1 restriction endonuclease subunit S [Klebsiella pasteurii]MDV1077982.1 restriction endonuclease subunit S [Klebsiella pasteurii]
MGSKWPEFRLDEITTLIIDCPHSTPEWTDSGVIVLRSNNIRNGSLDLTNPSFTTEEGYLDRIKRAIPTADDIVLTREAPMGEVCIIPKGLKCCLGQRMVLIRADKTQVIPEYLLYAIQSSYIQNQISWNEGTGTTVSNIRIPNIKALKIPLPSLNIQRGIVSNLLSVDKKISLNIATNQTLEQMSQTLFKSWFVDFDPVIDNALDAGNPIPEALRSRAELRQKVRNSADFKPLPGNIRALFPTEFEEMELSLIPKGWKFSNVGSLLKNTIGGDWGSDSEDEKHTTQAMIVRGTDIPELISGKLSSAPYRWVEPKKLEKRRINVGDIIIEVSGGSPTQSTGRSIFMTEQIIDRLGGVVEPASFCRKFEPLSVELGLIISLHLSKIYNDGKMWEYQNQSTGIANFQTKYFLEAEQIVIPSAQVINAFYRIVMPWIDKSHNNEQIILGNLRDTLLPKLISGELSLEDLPNLANQTEPA